MIGNLSCSVHGRRIFLNYIISAVVLLLFSTILYAYFQKTGKLSFPLQKTSQGSFSRSFHDIKGFNYNRIEPGQHIFRMTADRFKIEKAKLGLFRFGLMKQAVFNNVRIKIIQADINNKDGILPDFTVNQMHVICKPITIQVFSETGTLETTISAGSAGINKQKQQIIFKDNVKIETKFRTLETRTLVVTSKHGTAVARNGYHLVTPEKNIKGSRLLTDIFLTEFNGITKGGP